MMLIAVAGGTSPTLGRAIITSIQQTANSCIILSRRCANALKSKYGAQVRQVDYEDVDSLVAALKNVHAVILVFKLRPPNWAAY